MSLDNDRATATRIEHDLGALRSKEAQEIKKEADAVQRMTAATASASRSSTPSIAAMHVRSAAREQQAVLSAQQRRARVAADIARKSQELARVRESISRGETAERKATTAQAAKQRKADERARVDLANANESLRRDYEARVANLEAQIAAQIEKQAANTETYQLHAADGQAEPYDFFFSHASADKAEFADAFIEKAKARGLQVWYDRFEIAWGDSIRKKIDEGLRSAYFGVVLLSPHFFERPWTNYELDAIVQRDLTGSGRLLPIWHRLTQDDVVAKAPALAGRLALSTASSTTDHIIEELVRIRDRFKDAMNGA